ncbi:MAG: hypothetical protein EA397_02690 [Deltaproteobacteria bacterium]|nr:MAG: hypothetical protein EA397_02690 [Deltaproteobacteria bacterium]
MPSYLRRLLRRTDGESESGSGSSSSSHASSADDLMCRIDDPRFVTEGQISALELDSETPILDAAMGQPFAAGASRGDFVWALARDVAGQSFDRDQAILWAESQGILSGRTDDDITRAEAATVLVRLLGLSTSLPEGDTAYFRDVMPSDWFFESAHATRRAGIFFGSENHFRGHDPISVDEARVVLQRAQSPRDLSAQEQSPDMPPQLEPDVLQRLLDHDRLSADEIAEARSLIAGRPQSERPDLYRQLASKVTYRNQRDNEGVYAAGEATNRGDVMCSMTSLAMALETLGIGADESEKSFEDILDETRHEGRMGSRYELTGQRNVAARFGADTDRVWTPAFNGAAQAKAYYEQNVLPRLERGESATLSMAWGNAGQHFHIVRLEWVESDGLRVDDPFGRLFHNGSFFTYDMNDLDSSEGGGAKGEDRLWTWETVAAVNRSRYVQFLSPSP